MNKTTGLYIHVPFCKSKCPYCDFYSVRYDKKRAMEYAKKVIDNIRFYEGTKFDTVYFGGGTPILLADEICEILTAIKPFITDNGEITLEANPCVTDNYNICSLKSAGVNKISFGIQSGVDSELKALGRLHNSKQAEKSVNIAFDNGIKNISGDIMIGLPNQTKESLSYTLDYMTDLPLTHISSYILKLEPDSYFGKNPPTLPDDDIVTDFYLHVSDCLYKKGFSHYEISNYSKPGYESKHNLKYWHCEEYIGIGPAAHSYYNGKRFFCDRDLDDFISSPLQKTIITDDSPGGFDEWVMLRLRLKEGIDFLAAENNFGIDKEFFIKRLKKIPGELYCLTDNNLSLTEKGFLVSNAVIGILTDI